jgi:glucoamylase
VSGDARLDCGFDGITESECEGKGCCWNPSASSEFGYTDNYPWCFFKAGHSCTINYNGTNPGFPENWYDLMYKNFLANLDVDGSGAVVAS